MPVLSNIAYRFVSSKADYPGITDYVNVHEVTDLPAFDPYGIGLISGSSGVPSLKNGFGTALDFMTSPPVINGVKDADTVDVEFFRHKVLVDISDNLELFNYINNSRRYGWREEERLLLEQDMFLMIHVLI